MAEQVSNYIYERGQREELRFDRLEKAHAATHSAFLFRHENLTEQKIEEMLQSFFPAKEDGTRRSSDDLFDGTYIPEIGQVNGIGAFISADTEWTPERKRELIAAFLAIAQIAPSVKEDIESLWYATKRNDLIVFAPGRDDKLMFYRSLAKADYKFDSFNFMSLSDPENNPAGITKCTPLSRLAYVQSGEALTTGCQTPIRVNGEQLGIWGTTLPLGAAFREALSDVPIKGSELYFIESNGSLIAHPDLLGKEQITQPDVDAIEERLHPEALASTVAQRSIVSGFVPADRGRLFEHINAVYHLDVPDWFVVIHIPNDVLFASTLDSVLPTFIVSLSVAFLCVGILVIFIRNFGIKPIVALARNFSSQEQEPRTREEDRALIDQTRKRQDEIGGLANVLEDYRRKTDSHLIELETRIAQRTKELKKANDAKSVFLATMSHELRTPMNGIIGVASALRKTDLREDQLEMAQLISRSAQQLERQLSDILDVSKVEAGRLDLNAEPFDLKETVSSICELYALSARDKGIAFHVDIAPDCQRMYIGDAVRLKQVIGNLTSNAIKFTSAGSVTLSISCLSTQDKRDALQIVVSDTGCGIDQSALSRVFDPFSQANQKVYQRYGGSGLWLSICKSLVELMDGSIKVESEYGKGSTFTAIIRLPRCQTVDMEMPSNPPAPAELDMSDKSLRVLLAEDHPINQRVIQLILSPLGYDVQTVENGQHALDRFTTEHFDFVIMDMQMPVMDGLEATRKIRSWEKERGRAACPIIMLSANAMKSHKELAKASGANVHIGKPVLPDLLINTIVHLLNEAAADTRLRASN